MYRSFWFCCLFGCLGVVFFFFKYFPWLLIFCFSDAYTIKIVNLKFLDFHSEQCSQILSILAVNESLFWSIINGAVAVLAT